MALLRLIRDTARRRRTRRQFDAWHRASARPNGRRARPRASEHVPPADVAQVQPREAGGWSFRLSGDLVLDLADHIDDPDLARRLDDAHRNHVTVLALSGDERDRIVRALANTSDDLQGMLRGSLVA